MCGICGTVRWSGEPTSAEDAVARMTATMHHRGPDDSGVVGVGRCWLGHRRLSIVDTSPNGHQPMTTTDEGVWIVLNGEIYGYRELADELREAGVEFRSSSDTEVLLHGYRRWGIDGLCRRIHGMFAFALWDRDREELYLVRDRFGEKPLYVRDRGTRISFASSIDALRAEDPAWCPAVDPDAAIGYFHLGFAPPGMSMVHGVERVEPGTYLRASRARRTATRYWHPTRTPTADRPRGEWLDDVERILTDSVKRQLVADVPVGCLLSGGIDSTLIASIAAPIHPDLQLFTVRMPGFGLDESEKATRIAKALGVRHHVVDAEPPTADEFVALQTTFSEPLGDASSIALYLVSKYAKKHITVVLTGDGGDELFAGYRSVTMNVGLERYRQLARSLPGRAALAAVGRLPRSVSRTAVGRRAATMSRLLASDARTMHTGRSLLPRELANELWGPRLADAAAESRFARHLTAIWEDCDQSSPLATMLEYDLRVWLPGDYLPKTDTSTMACSLESRAPFLDPTLADLALAIPDAVKLAGSESKSVLRDLVRRRVGAAAAAGAKQGFVVPVDRWLDGAWAHLVADLHESRAVRDGYVSVTAVDAIRRGARSDPIRFSRIRYTLLVFALWYERLSGPAEAPRC